MNKNLRTLTIGESWWLHRQSKAMTKADMAARCKMTVKAYSRVELDQEDSRQPSPPNVKLSIALLLALARRRHGKGLRATAELHECTHVTLLAREQRADPELVKAWEGLGYQF